MIASLGLNAGIPSNFVFNLALPTIAAVVAVNLYGVGHLLLSRFRLLPVLFLFLINPAFLQLTISGTEWSKLLWDSTRVIDGTINEYPLFSFIFGDVHAHVLGFIPQSTLILLITLALISFNRMNPVQRLMVILTTALALGSIPPTNTWDIFIYAPLIIVVGILLFGKELKSVTGISGDLSSLLGRIGGLCQQIRVTPPGNVLSRYFSGMRSAVCYTILVPLLGILCYLPFYLMMNAEGIQAIHIVPFPSSVSQFLLVNGIFLGILSLSLIPTLRKNPWIFLITLPLLATGYYAAAIAMVLLGAVIVRRDGAADLMAGVGLLILVFCEILYLQDSMGEQYFRMNTVFKFYIAAWFLFSCSSAYMLGQMLLLIQKKCAWVGKVIDGSIAVLLFLLLLLPVIVTLSHAGPYTPTLDGLAWLTVSHPEDHAAISWLREQKGNITLVEAEGGDFVYYSRVSAMTGIPTLIGWPFHETLWRKNNPPGWYAQRTTVVRTIYEDPSWCLKLMKMFGINLLYVGPAEHERYNVTLPSKGLEPVYSQDAVTIYKMSSA
jgi:YYY domain-containing protein